MRLACIEDGYMTLPRPDNCPNINRVGEQKVRFGSLNHARKITDETINLWCKILAECSNSELILKSISFKHTKEQEEVIKRFEKYGIDRERLILLPYQDTYKIHLDAYNSIDIALDPIPYGGATTTAEAIWMGVPVICRKGNTMASNLAASILGSANCKQYIADDEENYIKIAKGIYEKGPRYRNDRLRFIEDIKKSALNQPRRVSKELENIYTCALLSKESIFA